MDRVIERNEQPGKGFVCCYPSCARRSIATAAGVVFAIAIDVVVVVADIAAAAFVSKVRLSVSLASVRHVQWSHCRLVLLLMLATRRKGGSSH